MQKVNIFTFYEQYGIKTGKTIFFITVILIRIYFCNFEMKEAIEETVKQMIDTIDSR